MEVPNIPIQQPVQPTYPNNLFSGMGGVDILGINSKADRLEDALKLINELKQENEKLKVKNENLTEEKADLKFKARELEFDLKKSKDEEERLTKKLDDKSRPIFSDTTMEKIPSMLGAFVAARNQGLGAAIPEPPAEPIILISDEKQELIDNINLEAFTDEMAIKINYAALGVFTNNEFSEELTQLIDKYELEKEK